MRQIELTPEQLKRKNQEFFASIEPLNRELNKLAELAQIRVTIAPDGTSTAETVYEPWVEKSRAILMQSIELIRQQIFNPTPKGESENE